MGKIVLLGGVTPPLTLDLIDREIIALTEKKNPKVLYVPTAGGEDPGYCSFFRNIYEGRFACTVDILFLIKETPTEAEIREKIFSSDIIYIEGGSISRLMSNFKKYGINKMLEEAHEKGIVLAGKSAGAFCFARYYFENEETKDFMVEGFSDYNKVDCLNFIDLIVAPHYEAEGYVEKLETMIKSDNGTGVGVGIENNCALEIVDNKYRVISTIDEANAYRVYKTGNKLEKQLIVKDNEFRSLEELLHI